MNLFFADCGKDGIGIVGFRDHTHIECSCRCDTTSDTVWSALGHQRSDKDLPRKRDGFGFGEIDKDRLLCDENQALFQKVYFSLDSLDIGLNAVKTLCAERKQCAGNKTKLTYFLKPPGGVTFLPVKDLSTLEMTWKVGASYFFCKSG